MGTCVSTPLLSDNKSERSQVPNNHDESLTFIPRPVPIDLLHDIAPPEYHPPHAHRDLVPDVILEVLGDLSKHDLASVMRVCRSWNDICCTILWKSLDSPVPLLKILSPMAKTADGWRYTETRRLNWARFKHYHLHVRSLSNVHDFFPVSPLAYSRVVVALQDEPKILPLGLLPNLNTLVFGITANLLGAVHEKQMMTSLITSNLSRLTLRLGIWYTDALPKCELQLLLADIHARSPSLSRFEASYTVLSQSRPEIFEMIGPLLQHQVELQELSLNTGGFGRDSMRHLGRLQKLRSLAFVADFQADGEIAELFQLLASAVPQLRNLECRLGGHFQYRPLSFNPLRPLLQLSQLTTLVIKHTVELGTRDVRDMAASWGLLEKLRLRSDEQSLELGSPASILSTIAECFPHTFRSLDIRLHWKDGVPNPLTRDLTGGRSPTIDSLTINIGHALLPRDQQPKLAEFLASVTAPGVRIKTLGPDQGGRWDMLQWYEKALDSAIRKAHCSSTK